MNNSEGNTDFDIGTRWINFEGEYRLKNKQPTINSQLQIYTN